MSFEFDVLIAGAGPAGSVAAALLARAGMRVRLIDRARFPRPKLCGDTLNPGARARLDALNLLGDIDEAGLPVHGMILTGEGGVRVTGRYPRGITGRALMRRDLDVRLLRQAIAAGACFEEGVAVRDVIASGGRIEGLRLDGAGRTVEMRAPLTIAADGRRSTIAFGLGIARHPPRPRRWAIGAYFDGVEALTDLGEMHVRRDYYFGIAPVPDGLANACLVVEAPDRRLRMDPLAAIRDAIDRDPVMRDRFARARPIGPAAVLGPLAVDASAAGAPGLLLAGDAAGFVDPITGDGLRFAIGGAELAVDAALAAIVGGLRDPERQLRDARSALFGHKYRFNRVVRSITGSPAAVRAMVAAARVAPGAVAHLAYIAGDVGEAREGSGVLGF